MAKETQKKTDKAYRISAQQLIDESKSRQIIPCTLSFDIGLGGGIPLGATVVIAGKSKSGKSTSSLQFGANAQNLYGCKIFYFNIEGRLTDLVLKQIQGIQLDKDHFEVVMPPPIYDTKDKLVGYTKWSAERWWDEIGQCIINNPNSIIIVDSIAALSTEKETSESMGYQDRGGRNKIEAEFCRKYGDLVVPSRVTLFLISQIQANTSGYGPPLQAKVGNAVKHLADVNMFCKNTEKWKPDAQGRILGHDIIYAVEASALGPPHMEMKVPLRYGYGIDNIQDVVTHALTWNIIVRGGAWYKLPFLEKDDKFEYIDISGMSEDELDESGVVKIQGEMATRNWFLVHPDQLKIVEKLIRDKIFG
jgi:RecA/RadA recombinase